MSEISLLNISNYIKKRFEVSNILNILNTNFKWNNSELTNILNYRSSISEDLIVFKYLKMYDAQKSEILGTEY